MCRHTCTNMYIYVYMHMHVYEGIYIYTYQEASVQKVFRASSCIRTFGQGLAHPCQCTEHAMLASPVLPSCEKSSRLHPVLFPSFIGCFGVACKSVKRCYSQRAML